MDNNNKPKRLIIDFHTSDLVDVGQSFDDVAFEQALREGHIDAVTVFAKCHHGNFYYKDSKFHVHPRLHKDLLPLQLEACRRAGVDAYIYISAGCDQANAVAHPEWRIQYQPDKPTEFGAYYTVLCFNTPYLEVLAEHIREVVEKFRPIGIFVDIISEQDCYCEFCRRDRKEKGIDENDPRQMAEYRRNVLHKYYRTVEEAARSIKPDIKIFHNSGNIPRGRKDMLAINSHYELESLPTSIWGYDHFPASLSYLRHKGKQCIGMTGKFHGGWGDQGTYKYPDALLFESAQSLAFGAGICVGDQLHPSGVVDKYTYRNIGQAYAYYEKLQQYNDGYYYADVGILSQDLIETRFLQDGDTGVCRMLLEEKILFDVIDLDDVGPKYRVIVLPDTLELTEEMRDKLREYVKGGGKLLASGKSGLYNGGFAFDFGAEYVGEDNLIPCYYHPLYEVRYFRNEPLVVKAPAYSVRATGKTLAEKWMPYFNRKPESFCSHLHTPCNYDDKRVGVTEGKDGIYISSQIFTDYTQTGNMIDKLLVVPLLDRLLGERIVKTNLPSQAKVSLVRCGDDLVFHMLYANTIKRGQGIEVIEDIVPIYDAQANVCVDGKVKSVAVLPEGREIGFEQKGDRLSFTVDKFRAHAAVKISFEK